MVPSPIRPVLGVLAAVTLSAGFGVVPQAHAQVPAAAPVAPLDRDGEISRDDSRPALLPEVARALNQRQAELNQASVEIAVAERTQQVNEFAKQRAKTEAATRYAEQVEKLGYDPKTTDPRDIAKAMMLKVYEWGADEFTCVDKIWTQESNWQWNAENPTSGAYGIPQSLPASKLATAGDDWKTNPATQIKWSLGYIQDRYGTPCQALTFRKAHNWY